MTANHTTNTVQQLQRTLYLAAKRSARRRFHALYDKVSRPDVLSRAWTEVKANHGAAGVDGHSIAAIEAQGVGSFLDELRADLLAHRYRPHPVRRVFIPKPGRPAERRPLGIPNVRDRVVQQAAKLVLEPIFEAQFRDCSYGFRPRRSAHQALEQVRTVANQGMRWVVDADIKSFFDEIDHDVVLRLVQRRISDRSVLKLIKSWLRVGVMEEGAVRTAVAGTPQGGVISPLLANIVLHELDRVWEDRCSHLGVLVRYADDLVVLCASEAAAKESLRRIELILERLQLQVHPEKTRIVETHYGRDGFDFLGFHHRVKESWRWRGRWYMQRWPSVRAMKAIRSKVRDVVASRSVLSTTLAVRIRALNPVLRGWGRYFSAGNSTGKLAAVDKYVYLRLAIFLRNKHQRRYLGMVGPRLNILFDALGLVRLTGTVRYAQGVHAVR